MELELRTVDEEAVLTHFRKQEAAQAVFDAAVAAIWVRQYEELKVRFSDRKGLDHEIKERADDAKGKRTRADNLLRLAGMKEGEMSRAVIDGLTSQLRTFEEEYLRKTDIHEHPEAYGDRLGADAEFDVARTEEAVRAAQAELDAWSSEKDQ